VRRRPVGLWWSLVGVCVWRVRADAAAEAPLLLGGVSSSTRSSGRRDCRDRGQPAELLTITRARSPSATPPKRRGRCRAGGERTCSRSISRLILQETDLRGVAAWKRHLRSSVLRRRYRAGRVVARSTRC